LFVKYVSVLEEVAFLSGIIQCVLDLNKLPALTSCLINAWPLPANKMGTTNQLSGRGIVI